jgi:hypothetical protein
MDHELSVEAADLPAFRHTWREDLWCAVPCGQSLPQVLEVQTWDLCALTVSGIERPPGFDAAAAASIYSDSHQGGAWSMADFSVIVCTLNRSGIIGRCVGSIIAAAERAKRAYNVSVELIIVDNKDFTIKCYHVVTRETFL